MAAPEPHYRLVEQHGQFQIRDYPALSIAEVTTEGGQWGAANRGFKILAGYIFGGNQAAHKIEMTAPVIQVPLASQERQEDSHWVVRFFMPDGLAPSQLPPPNDKRVRLLELAPARYVVLRFSGWALPFIVRGETRQLEAWMRTRHLVATGPVELAQYDPPWTIWFLRRNEVLAPIAP